MRSLCGGKVVCTEVCSLFKIPGEGEILVRFVDSANSMGTLYMYMYPVHVLTTGKDI